MDTGLEQILSNANSIQENEDDSEVIADLSGFQVTKAELFSHTREPAVTIWENRIKFNMACLRRFPGVTHIQVLIHPEQKRLIIRPCNADAPDSLRWARGGGDKELANRDLLCKIFARKVFDMMGWDTQFELFIIGGKKRHSYLPGDWRDYFGVPVEEHEESYKIDLADGYITTDKA